MGAISKKISSIKNIINEFGISENFNGMRSIWESISQNAPNMKKILQKYDEIIKLKNESIKNREIAVHFVCNEILDESVSIDALQKELTDFSLDYAPKYDLVHENVLSDIIGLYENSKTKRYVSMDRLYDFILNCESKNENIEKEMEYENIDENFVSLSIAKEKGDTPKAMFIMEEAKKSAISTLKENLFKYAKPEDRAEIFEMFENVKDMNFSNMDFDEMMEKYQTLKILNSDLS